MSDTLTLDSNVQIAGFVDLPIADNRVALPRMRDRVDDDTQVTVPFCRVCGGGSERESPSAAATHRFAMTVPLSAGKRAPPRNWARRIYPALFNALLSPDQPLPPKGSLAELSYEPSSIPPARPALH
jgi:hypothetical protein